MKNIYDYVEKYENMEGEIRYSVFVEFSYYSPRYKKTVIAKCGDDFDGATGAKDINSFGWIVHDVLKRDKCFSDGSHCSNNQASNVLYDILKSEGRWFRARSWYWSTLLWGTFVK